MPIALLLLLLLGGGTGIAAENSLPGDTLYPIKIHVNENLESLIAVTPKGDAEVSVRQAARRLEEAEKLKEKGSLSSTQSADIKNSFLQEVDSINKNISKIKAKGDSQFVERINSEFEKEIDDHYDAFLSIDSSGTTSPQIFSEIKKSRESRINEENDNENIGNNVKSKIKKSESEVKITSDGDDGENEDDEGDDDNEDNSRGSSSTNISPVTVPTPSGTQNPSAITKYTLSQVATHNNSTDCWSVVNGGVYNLTSWIAQHPGGQSAIKGMCGIDATSAFMAQHSGQSRPEAELASFKIGVLQ